jgi:aldehyde dehydrogenase (NAD+)
LTNRPEVEISAQAFRTAWGSKVPGKLRRDMLLKLADLIEERLEEFAAIESLDSGQYMTSYLWNRLHENINITGKLFKNTKFGDVPGAINALRFTAGLADKISGKTMEVRPVATRLPTQY